MIIVLCSAYSLINLPMLNKFSRKYRTLSLVFSKGYISLIMNLTGLLMEVVFSVITHDSMGEKKLKSIF